MKRGLLLTLTVLAATLGFAPSTQASTGLCTGQAPVGYAHVVWVVFENRSYNEVTGHAPYIDGLVAQCGSALNMHNISHPSQPNYIAATSGKPLALLPKNDCATFCPQSGPSIFSQSPSWRVYAESMPSPCLKNDSGTYRVHHTAAPYYALTNCPANDLPLTAYNPSSLPAFTLISPNTRNDMHENSSSVAAGNAWLSTFLPPLLATADYQAGRTVVFITWDEGGFPRSTSNCATSADNGCHIATLALAKTVRAGVKPSLSLNLYGLLRGTEELLGYPLLGQASTAASVRSAFGL